MTNSRASQTFDAHAPGYDDARRRLVPCFDRFYGTAVALLALAGDVEDVLDLGAGTGLLSALVADSHPGVRLTLIDGAPTMLAQARARLDTDVVVRVQDFAEPLPAGPFDAVVSALAIHHLDDGGKRALYAATLSVLRPGGVFVNAEQVLGATPRLTAAYVADHERRSRALGSTDAEWDASLVRQRHDRCATVGAQLKMLADVGFVDVDCPMRDGRFAVLLGVRPSGSVRRSVRSTPVEVDPAPRGLDAHDSDADGVAEAQRRF